jgi:hypothetical protein
MSASRRQIVQAILDYIADADDTSEPAVAQHWHVAHAMVRHQIHHAGDTLLRGHGDPAVRLASRLPGSLPLEAALRNCRRILRQSERRGCRGPKQGSVG